MGKRQLGIGNRELTTLLHSHKPILNTLTLYPIPYTLYPILNFQYPIHNPNKSHMKKLLLLVLFFLSFYFSFSQSRPSNWCGFNTKLEEQLKNNPNLQMEYYQWRENVRSAVEKVEFEKSPSGVLQIIPVVVHVIHDNGIGNISEDQVLDGIRVLNEDYVRQNADTSLTRPVFKPHAGIADFEFRLAKKDPSGNPTNGIVRINSQLTYEADDNTKTLSYWNSSKYFNIWLVNTISGSTQTSTILGYAQFPGWGNWTKYGVIMLHSQFGRFGTSSSEGRTASHEVGHCLNLYHTFEGGCGGSNCASNGDDVCDTPPTANSTQGCSLTQNLCSNDAGGGSPYSADVEDQIENYMSYDDCQNMFSKNQITRMKAAIVNNTQLQTLISESNLDATGVNSLYAADFSSNVNVVCAGQTVKFSDYSYYGQKNWIWAFQGGTPGSSLLKNPEISYFTPGLYNVSLSASDGISTKSKTSQNYILVVNSDSNYLPFSEGFESGTIPGTKWFVANIDNDANTFTKVTGVGFSGNACVKLDNNGNLVGQKDELIAGSFDFSSMTSVTINFKTAYAQKDTSTKDKLRVLVSSDCGSSWAPRFAKVGSSLASAPAQTTPFTPADSSKWKSQSATLTSSMLKENVLIKFSFESDEGNNFYLDDINITGTYNSIPVLVLPPNNSVGQPDEILLDWKSVGGVSKYQHEIDTTPNFNSPLYDLGQHNFISTDPNGDDTEHSYGGLLHGKKYFWRARTITNTDTSAWTSVWNFTISENGVGEKEFLSDSKKNRIDIFPNPLGETSEILLNLTEPCVTSIEVNDIMGRNVNLLSREKFLEKGPHSFFIHKADFSQGLYLLKMELNGNISYKKFVVQ